MAAPRLAGVSPAGPAAVPGRGDPLAAHRVPHHQDGRLQPGAALHRPAAHVQHAGHQQGTAEPHGRSEGRVDLLPEGC